MNFHLTLSSDVVAHLAEVVADDKSLVRAEAAEILGQLGPAAHAALPALRSLRNDKNPDFRQTSRDAIERIQQNSSGT